MNTWSWMIREGGKYIPIENRYSAKQDSQHFTKLVEKYLRVIRRHMKNTTVAPIRFEVEDPSDDEIAIIQATKIMCNVGTGSIGDDYIGLPFSIGRAEIPMRNGKHMQRIVVRAANQLKPVKTVLGPRADQYPNPEDHEVLYQHNGEPATKAEIPMLKQLDKLKMKYGPAHHVSTMVNDDGYYFEIWRGEDWLAMESAALYPAELANKVNEAFYSKHNLEMQKPVVVKAAQTLSRLRAMSGSGGKARGLKKYGRTDEQIKAAFIDYRRRNPCHSYAAAELNISVKLKYAIASKLGDRIQRMTKITPAKWYSTL